MSRRIPIRDIVRWTGVGLCAAVLLIWSTSLLFFPPPLEPKGSQRGSYHGIIHVDDGLKYLGVPALTAVAILFFLLLFSPEHRKFPSTHCRKCRYPLVGITSGRCPECGTIIPTFRPTSAAHLVTPQPPPQRPPP